MPFGVSSTSMARSGFTRRVLPALVAVVSGWTLGILLASPYLLPILEYSQTGARMARRSQGEEERPPVGLAALPQTVLPDMYGSTQDGSFAIFPDRGRRKPTGELGGDLHRPAGHASGGALGLVQPAAPIHQHLLVVLGVPRPELVPGRAGGRRFVAVAGPEHDVAQPLRLRNVVRHSRHDGRGAGRSVAGGRAVAAVVLGARSRCWRCCCSGASIGRRSCRTTSATRLEHAVAGATTCGAIADLAAVAGSKRPLSVLTRWPPLLCVLGLAGWLLLGLRAKWRPWLLSGLAAVLLADLLWFAYGRSGAVRSGTVLSPDSGLGATGEGDARPDHWIPLPAGDPRPNARPARHSRLRRAWTRPA